jgi:PAS domain S-box-containing protein
MIEALSHSVAVTDNSSARLITYVNPAFLELTGYSEEECLGRNCSFLQGPKTDVNTVLEIAEALNRGDPIRRVVLNYRKDGITFWNYVHIIPLIDKNGVVYSFLGIQHKLNTKGNIDITTQG